MTETIRALAFERPALDTSATRVLEIARPQAGAGEVAIDVRYAGVNFKDVMSRRGDPGYVSSWPHVPGIEVAGLITEVGPGVVGLRCGQPVVALTNDGGLAEVATASAALTVPVPEGVHLGRAAAVPGALSTAALLLDQSHITAGESLLVHSAAGAVGQALAQLARRRGVDTLIGTVGHENRRAAALAHGYDTVLTRDDRLPAVLGRLGRRIDVILDPQGLDMIEVDLAVAAPGARIIIFGNAGGGTLGSLPGMGPLFAHNVSIGGFSLKTLSGSAPQRVRAAIAGVLGLLAAGALTVEADYLDGLSAAPEGQQALSEGRGRGKFIVAVSSASTHASNTAGADPR